MRSAQAVAGAHQRAQELLAGLAQGPAGTLPADDVAVVLAHPDDETIGCGGQLHRMLGVTVMVVTDGAPRSLGVGARRQAAVRAREWHEALSIAGIPVGARRMLAIPDQGASFEIAHIADEIADALRRRRTRVVLTHAYEGGHPDHDATAMAVHRAVHTLSREGRDVGIIEMPFYRDVDGRFAWQSFHPDERCSSSQIDVPLSRLQIRIKAAMRDAHASQAQVLRYVAPDREMFRLAPDYDFHGAANGGHLLYERLDLGLDGARWHTIIESLESAEFLPDTPRCSPCSMSLIPSRPSASTLSAAPSRLSD
jgi:LmbE family N-acetylglucosaminyl deacetylase